MPKILSNFAAAGGLALAALSPHSSGAATPVLTTLFSFDGNNAAHPDAPVIVDAQGNLLGTTSGGGNQACAGGCGTVFELVKTNGGYASSPTILVTFDHDNGAAPQASLIADASGNLFGTTRYGGSGCGGNGCGTVFEIAKTDQGYASAPTTLVRFDLTNGAQPAAGLIFDVDGNLYGTTYGGGSTACAGGCGTVFKIAKTGQGYASTPTTLVSFDGTNNASPTASLIFDAQGNLFGTTSAGGNTNCDNGCGTVFEIAKTRSGYAGIPTTLVSFDGSSGANPAAGLIFNQKGDLLGTAFSGGPYGLGTVFQIAKTRNGYASLPSTLVSFNGANGASPFSGLIADARGNLFGTSVGGTDYPGTVFELAKTRSGYATTLTILASFNVNGVISAEPTGLVADVQGNLFGPTYFGGASNQGSVYELTGSGFVPALVFAGTPGSTDCYGESMLSLQREGKNLDAAAATLGLGQAEGLQTALSEYCGTRAP
jgi:uncharacterized repeat protein (TIGR03803 family)